MPHATAAQPAIASRITGESHLRIWSLPAAERLRRLCKRAGAASTVESAELVLLLRADWVYDDPLVRGLAKQGQPCSLWADNGSCVAMLVPPARSDEAAALLQNSQAPADLPRLTAAQVAGHYNDALRKREPPYLLPLTGETLGTIEARVFAGSYKGVTDFVTLYLWPRPARAFTRMCANLGITPNLVTTVSLVLVLLAMWGFWQGQYAWGLLAAWGMTFLDTVDGKLARVTLQSSPFGDIYDHSIDLLHPPFWWWAWVVGLASVGLPLAPDTIALKVIIAGYILQRLEEGLFIKFFKMDMHVWQRFDSLLRLITARRNSNLAILTVAVVLGRPDVGINIVAAWVVVCLVIHAVRLLQAALARRGGPLRSWLA
ncbi:MAG: CDP-alcohol phosphatidyltransferase family protein [Steroidobacteraceae bacterium]